MIKIGVTELETILQTTPASQNIMLVGRHGIGKSRIITDHFQRQGERVITFFLGQMSDPGDLIGLMYRDEQSHRSRFMPPYWWPEGEESVVLFLDELNRARPEILQAVMDLTLNRRLAGRELPSGSRILSAINNGELYQTTDLDPALVSRFNLYQFEPTLEEWLDWAHGAAIHTSVIQLIQSQHHLLDGSLAEIELSGDLLEKQPDRRAWERVSDYLKVVTEIGPTHIKALAGIIGVGAALELQRVLQSQLALNSEDILERFSRQRGKIKALSLPQLAILNEQIAHRLSEGHKSDKTVAKWLKNLHGYLSELQQLEQREAVAQFASLLGRPKFKQVASLVMIESDELMALLADYIDTIQL
ncbi:AAA family ATPase [Ectothiorhodospiraceae bacterium BW-2]|nr:AAA family ATPase [Ectothiorhodospiraceae bacterium BW-2]